MNQTSVDLVLFSTGDQAAAHGPGGAVWCEDETHLYLRFPGCANLDAIPVSRDQAVAQANARVWLLTGPADKPTLHPSLKSGEVWHGWLRDGRLLSC